MEETLEGGRGPPRAVVPLERERENSISGKISWNAWEIDERWIVNGREGCPHVLEPIGNIRTM
jgi:hypothetical protein